jgi:hypothetical protein
MELEHPTQPESLSENALSNQDVPVSLNRHRYVDCILIHRSSGVDDQPLAAPLVDLPTGTAFMVRLSTTQPQTVFLDLILVLAWFPRVTAHRVKAQAGGSAVASRV